MNSSSVQRFVEVIGLIFRVDEGVFVILKSGSTILPK
jgi:hypothetical protein